MEPSKKLAAALTDSGMTPADFARAMKTDPQTINNWLNRGAPAKHSFKAGKVLRQDPAWLCLTQKEYEALNGSKKPKLEQQKAKQFSDAMRTLSPDQFDLVLQLVSQFRPKS